MIFKVSRVLQGIADISRGWLAGQMRRRHGASVQTGGLRGRHAPSSRGRQRALIQQF